jgi:outer membrane protein assembly factor BamB
MRTLLSAVVLLMGVGAVASWAEDWPQWRGAGRDAVWNETGTLEQFAAGGLAERWRAEVGWGYSSPVVAGGRVYVTDADLSGPRARERVHCFDEASGKVVWEQGYAVDYVTRRFADATNKSGPAATPIVRDGRVYTLGRCGDLFCLDAVSGAVVWRIELERAYPGSKLVCNASPLIEGELLIAMVGATPGACVIALEKGSGKEVWRALAEGGTNSSPIVVTAGGVRQLIVWTEESVTSLDPATGRTHWRQRLAKTSDYVVSTPVVRGKWLLVGGLMMSLDAEKPAASVVWPKSRVTARRVLSNTSSAMMDGECVYTAKSSGELVCLDAKTGEQIWESGKVTELRSGASIHMTVHGDDVLLYTDRGELIRARLTRGGYEEMGRASLVEPTCQYGARRCAWSPPAFADGRVFVRNDARVVCYGLVKG